jgi:hypothetical protein
MDGGRSDSLNSAIDESESGVPELSDQLESFEGPKKLSDFSMEGTLGEMQMENESSEFEMMDATNTKTSRRKGMATHGYSHMKDTANQGKSQVQMRNRQRKGKRSNKKLSKKARDNI